MTNQLTSVWNPDSRLKREKRRLSGASAWELESKAAYNTAEGFTNRDGTGFEVLTRFAKGDEVC
jgi:hypothetical protein